ncbi:hypothetical protein [Paenibacillus alba]|uniref:Heparin-sulfate lyase N-terminal domain-containing protein n=1 Tax=Paenibacillus alba TaxID=1197127 RepID=A0ABU6G5Z0_9BACL|nr:hypothetical protein [Paenibacillus alba]MEC0229594.1 hypothetical protein [Paenibacillus alba]
MDFIQLSGDAELLASKAMMSFAERSAYLLDKQIQQDLSKDLYGGIAIANLSKAMYVKASNQSLVRTAEWFKHPHLYGRDPQGESDFAAIKLIRALYQFESVGLLEEQTRSAIRKFYLHDDFESKYKSENHMLLFHTSRYLAAQKFPLECFKAYGKEGRELLEEEGNFLREYLVFRAKRGWAEFDSSSYMPEVMECLLCLYDYANDPELVKLARMMLDVLLLDMVCDSLDGLYGGAHGRIYAPVALDHARSGTFPIYELYFGHSYRAMIQAPCLIAAICSSYRPSQQIYEIALGRTKVYVHQESKHLHCITCETPHKQLPQEDGSINKYTYYTPRFIMGAVNYQDAYAQGSEAGWYAHHQQHQWDLSLPEATNLKIFSHHPGHHGTEGSEHGYWTGDLGCGCGHFFGEKNVVMAMYQIPETQAMHWIHVHVPRDAFDEVEEEGNYLFLRKSGVYICLFIHNGYNWTTEGEFAGREVISHGRRNAVICEVGDDRAYEDFASFRRMMLLNRLDFDSVRMQLTYCSFQVGELSMNQTMRTVQGETVIFPYPTYNGPYMVSAFNSGVIEVRSNGNKVIYDFNQITVKHE